MNTNKLNLILWALLPAALVTLTSCSSTPKPPPDAGSVRVTYTEGVPGGVIVQTFKATATVTAIDQAKRKATLLAPDGKKFTVEVGPEAVNFDQISKGDLVYVTVAQKLVAYLDEKGTVSGAGSAAIVAQSPNGAQPGGFTAETIQVTAKVVAFDLEKRTATLRFDDGSTQTLPVRSDIDLGRRKVGEQVVFRVTEMIAVRVTKLQ